ncbi:MAG: N-acetylmuramoyl-L-alanine amidase, partial [Cyanobacteriota bacterium]
MNRIYSLLFLIFLLFIIILPAESAQHLELSYPAKTAKINAPNTYFIGNTTPGSSLTINSTPVELYEGGIFTKVMPLKSGMNVFKVKSVKSGQTAEQIITIWTSRQEESLPEYPVQIANNTISPSGSKIYTSGDIINVNFKGSPGGNASFSLAGKTYPMTELPPQIDTVKMMVLGEVYGIIPKEMKGIYNGVYEIKPGDKYYQAPLKVHLSDGKGTCKTLIASTKITTWDSSIPRVGEIITNTAAARTGPGDSRITPLPKGVKLHLKGYDNGYYRYYMGPYQEGFIAESQIKILPQGTPVPFSEIRSIDVKKSNRATYLNIPVTTRLPYSIEQSIDQSRLTVTLYGARADTDIIRYNIDDPYISNINWSQPFQNVYVIDILFKKNQQWGYEVLYRGFENKGNLNFTIKIKSPPEVNSQLPLNGKIIAIDPGHGGWEKGSNGFGLIPEKVINLIISKKIARLLEEQGATAVLTRRDDSAIDIYARPDFAATNNADLFISIHNNAMPDGRDPLIEHGSSSYYYHPMAQPLAVSIQKQMLAQLGFNDFGLYYDNLALPRENRMPSVLIEIGFMINPHEYLNLITPEFQEKAAKAIVDGIKDFFITTK